MVHRHELVFRYCITRVQNDWTLVSNRPFPSYLVFLFQNEPSCKTFHVKMGLICTKMNLQEEKNFMRMVSHDGHSGNQPFDFTSAIRKLLDRNIFFFVACS